MDIDKIQAFINSIDLDNLSPEQEAYLEKQRIKREQWLADFNRRVAERKTQLNAEMEAHHKRVAEQMEQQQAQIRSEMRERHIAHLRQQAAWYRQIADRCEREADGEEKGLR